MGYSIILPTFNEKGNIKKIHSKLSTIFKKYHYEIIFIDDSSNDGSQKEIKNLARNNLYVKYFFRNEKRSIVKSIIKGIFLSKHKYIIWMDADLSHQPEALKKIFKLKKKYDLIVFSRFLNESKRTYDNSKKYSKQPIDILSNILNLICRRLLFENFTDYTSGFICIKKSKLKNIKIKGYYGDYFIKLIFDCLKNKYSFKELPFDEAPRKSGISKTTLGIIPFIIKCYFYLYRLFICKLKIFFL